jgi:hypothetical protein
MRLGPTRSTFPAALLALAGCLVHAATWPHRALALDGALCELTTDGRVVAIGDVHGAHEPFAALLREAQLIDDRERWIGGDAWLVQTGDVLDRGPDSKRVIDLLRKLERDAARAGGAVYALLGNHELMRLMGDYRYVSEGEYTAFRSGESRARRETSLGQATRAAAQRAAADRQPFDAAAFRERFLAAVPLGFVEMRAAFATTGSYGEWLRSRPAVVMINGIAFVHGGISAAAAPLGCRGVNDAVENELRAARGATGGTALSSSEAGPLWYRGLAQEPEDGFAPTLDRILDEFAARAFVIGHTPEPGQIVARFGGRVVVIDSGMLGGAFYPGGAPAALELDGPTLTAIYVDGRRENVGAPPPAAP